MADQLNAPSQTHQSLLDFSLHAVLLARSFFCAMKFAKKHEAIKHKAQVPRRVIPSVLA